MKLKNHPKKDNIELEKLSNNFVKSVENNIENFSYNKIIANFHEMYASLNKQVDNKIDKNSLLKNYKKILIVMKPVIPHFVSECLKKINVEDTNEINWPKINKNLLIEDKINLVIQINGKKRSILEIDKGTPESDILLKIKEDQKLKNHIQDKKIKKTIFIPDRLVNIIVN